MHLYDFDWDLQLFADGGGAAGAAAGGDGAGEGQTGVSAPDAGEAPVNNRRQSRRQQPLNVEYGVAPDEGAQQPAEPQAEAKPQEETPETFESLIKGKYKEDYDKRVQEAISRRFKTAEKDKQTVASLAPVLQKLASKYEMDLSEITDEKLNALIAAVDEDDSYLEEEADRLGITVRALKSKKRLEAENARLKQAEQQLKQAEQQRQAEAQRRAEFDRLYQQAEAAKQFYPGFNLAAELDNPEFKRLAHVGVDAKTAYEVVHKDDILRGSMAYAAQTAAQKVSNAVQANALRPSEGGLAKSSAAKVRVSDPRQLTPEQRKDLRNRVRRGEKIQW